jgi:hypothetical protein
MLMLDRIRIEQKGRGKLQCVLLWLLLFLLLLLLLLLLFIVLETHLFA